jgi:alkyl hydroperoxide reductase subunit AhpC
VTAFMNELGINVPVVIDTDAKINNTYGVLNLPVTFIIDPDGVVRYQHFGEMTPDLLKQYLADQGFATTSEF